MADKQTNSRRRDKPTTPGLLIWAVGVLAVGALLVIGLALAGVFRLPAPTVVPPVPAVASPDPATEPPPPAYVPPRSLPTADSAAIQLAVDGVAANGDWTPVMREFDGVEMALVPVGCFMMGSEYGYEDELPVHEVCLDEPFWIDVYEVTNEQYGSSGAWPGDNLPRETVDWLEAAAHCESRGARLPSEAEWEYAARGPDGLIFPWGDEFNCRLGNFDDETRHTSWVLEGAKGCDGFIETAPVGSFPDGASWVGALDMSGNVLEWLADWHDRDYYDRSPRDNPGGPDSGEFRVLRGGSWLDFDGDFVRGALRRSALPVGVADYYGIRCALSYQ